jgi:hypothetical protein
VEESLRRSVGPVKMALMGSAPASGLAPACLSPSASAHSLYSEPPLTPGSTGTGTGDSSGNTTPRVGGAAEGSVATNGTTVSFAEQVVTSHDNVFEIFDATGPRSRLMLYTPKNPAAAAAQKSTGAIV